MRRARSPASQLAIDDTIAYGRERKAFGKPIIKREVWQHKFVDLYTKLEAAKALTLQGRRRRTTTSAT